MPGHSRSTSPYTAYAPRSSSLFLVSATMHILLWYLYTDELPTTVADPKPLLVAADEYGLDRLVALTASTVSYGLIIFSPPAQSCWQGG